MKKIFSLLWILLFSACLTAQNKDYELNSISFRSPLTAIDISPDGAWILVGSEDGTLTILNAQTLREKLEFEAVSQSAVYDIEMSPKMDVIFLAAGSRIMLYDTTGIHITNWPHHKNTMWSMDISRDGAFIVSTEVNKTFQLSNVYEGRIEAGMRGHDDITLAVAFSPDGKQIASGSNDKKVFLWDLASKEIIGEFQGHSDNIYDVAFSPDGKLIAACSKDRTVRIWNIEENKLLHILKGHQDMVLEIEFSPDGNYLLSASTDQSINLWEVASGERLYAYLENEAGLSDIEFFPDGKTFLSAGVDGKLKLWEINPEIFVLKYFPEEYNKELNENPLFAPREKGEKKADYDLRMEKAATEKAILIEKYYAKYLKQ